LILNIDITQYTHPVTSHEIGLARDQLSAKVLRHNYAPKWFSAPATRQWQPDLNGTPGFQRYVNKYAEVVLADPWADIVLYYDQAARLAGAQIPLGYPPRYPLLNSSAMAMAAEALAGWHCETTYPWAFLGRPQRVSPDMIFYDPSSARFALVEVKSSGRPSLNVNAKLTSDMIKLFRTLALTKHISAGRYVAGVILVQVTGRASVSLTSLILEEA
jgi:hypothetical protein